MQGIGTRSWIVAVAAFGASTAGAAEIVVDASGAGDYTDLQAAIDAAAPDDLVFVRPGSYDGPVLIDGKPLWVAAATAGTVLIDNTLTVRNLAEGEEVVLVGLEVQGYYDEDEPPVPGLLIENNVGEVRVQGCVLRGAHGKQCDGCFPTPNGGHGAEVWNSFRVDFSASQLFGGSGGNEAATHDCWWTAAGEGLLSELSAVSAWDCTFQGGWGSFCRFGGPSGEGGAGFRSLTFGLFASGCTFQGGNGGDNGDFFLTAGGNGGDGLVVEAGSQARLIEATMAGGAGGVSFTGPPGAPGVPMSGAGPVAQFAGDARLVGGPGVVTGSTTLDLTVEGTPDDLVYLRFSGQSEYRYRPRLKGYSLVDNRWINEVPVGVIPGSGVLVTSYELLPASMVAPGSRLPFFVQGLMLGAGGERRLASPLHVLLRN